MKPKKLPLPVRRWLNALRSGKYKQGKGILNRNNKEFCCLGVACEIFRRSTGVKKTKGKGGRMLYNGHDSWLPPGY